jgi:hypothetical protein
MFIHNAIAVARLGRRKFAQLRRKLQDNAELRERIAATCAFSFIFVFAAASVDAIVTGAADWSPGAEAAEYRAAPALAYVAPVFVGADEPPAAREELALVSYSVSTEALLGGPDATLPVGTQPEVLAEPVKPPPVTVEAVARVGKATS